MFYISQIHINLEYIYYLLNDKNLLNKKFLLEKKQKYQNYLEKIIHLSVIKNLENIKILYDEELHNIEFSITNEFQDFFTNNTSLYKTPLLNIFIYLNEIESPTIITNVTDEIYKNRNYTEDFNIGVVYPKILKSVSFEGKYYYNNGVNLKTKEKNIICIKIWDEKKKIAYYNKKESFFYQI
jgi:hypothetical protein